MTDVKPVVQKVPLVNQLTYLGQAFSRLVELMLSYLVGRLVRLMEDNSGNPALANMAATHVVINNIITLGTAFKHFMSSGYNIVVAFKAAEERNISWGKMFLFKNVQFW